MTDKSQNHEKQELFYSRLKLVFVISLFLGPLLAAFLWYYGLDAKMVPQGKTNHARLIQPVVTLAPFENNLYDQGSINFDSLKRKWTVVHLLKSVCDQQCEKSLYNTRQTRIALGKGIDRVQRFVFVDNAILARQIQQNHVDATLVIPSDGGLDIQLQALIKKKTLGVNDALLVDPLGNVMLVIPADLDPGLLLKDLKKLLKVSRIG